MPQRDGYIFRVDFTSALINGFSLEQHHSPDDKFQLDFTSANNGSSVLNPDCSGQYGGLWFKNVATNVHFVVGLGVHNWITWLDINEIRIGETFESVREEYYHYREAHDTNNSRCRCISP